MITVYENQQPLFLRAICMPYILISGDLKRGEWCTSDPFIMNLRMTFLWDIVPLPVKLFLEVAEQTKFKKEKF